MKLYSIAYLIITVLLLHAFTDARSQDFRADVKAMKATFARIKRIHAEVEARVYESATSSEVIEVRKSNIKKDFDNYLYHMDNLTMLMNDKCLLLIHHGEKQMVYSKRDKKSEKKFGYGTLTPDIDSVLNRHDSVVYKGTSNNVKHYIIYSKKGFIQETDVFLDSKSNMMKKLVYYYNTELFPVGNKVVVEYKTFNLSPKFGPSDFSEKQFVNRGRELEPSKAYSGYSVLDYDPNTF